MTDYVVGIVSVNQPDCLLVVRKTHPDWQAGLLNGIGGKIEPGESALEAMELEAFEEARITDCKWENFLCLTSGGNFIRFFRTIWNPELATIPFSNDVGETLHLISNSSLEYRKDVIPNLKWIIPLALFSNFPYPIGVSE